MSDITYRWDGDYYLTKEQYEGTQKLFKTKINNPNNLNTIGTTSTAEITWNPYAIEKPNLYITDCGPTYLSNIVGEHKSLLGLTLYYLKVERIIFNPPATVVFWEDATKTVVKCAEDDEFNPEIGVAMCYMKKIYGSRHAFSKMVEKYIID